MHLPAKYARSLRLALAAALAASAVKAMWLLGEQLTWIWERQAYVFGDGDFYFAMGRGILNGLRPYEDLFETKPPGIFFLSVLSLAITGDATLYFIVAMAALLAIALALGLWSFWETRQASAIQRLMMTLLAIVFGAAIALHVSSGSGGYQTELFGAAFAILYLTLIATRNTIGWPRALAAVATLAGSIGMKEPFMISLFAGAILLADDWRWLVRRFVLPLSGAVCLGVIVLAVSGYLRPYVTIYLPEILSYRLASEAAYQLPGGVVVGDSPLWLRGLQSLRLWGDAWNSPAPLFRFVVVGLLALAATCPSAKTLNTPRRMFLGVTALSLLYLMHRTFILLQIVLLSQRVTVSGGPAAFLALFWWDLLFLILAVVGLAWAWVQDRVQVVRILQVVAAVYLTVLAVGAGGHFWHTHLLFAVPLYVAAFLRFALSAEHAPEQRFSWGTTVITVLAALAVFAAPSTAFLEKRASAAPDLQGLQRKNELTLQLDRLMDACKIDRYVSWQRIFSGTTRHSPYGLSHENVRAFDANPNLLFRRKYFQDLSEAKLFIVADSKVPLDPAVQRVIEEEFTRRAPVCALPFVPLGNLQLYFRADAA